MAEVWGGRGQRGFEKPNLLYGLFSKYLTCQKTFQNHITGPMFGCVWGGEGSAEAQPKAQVCPGFFEAFPYLFKNLFKSPLFCQAQFQLASPVTVKMRLGKASKKKKLQTWAFGST